MSTTVVNRKHNPNFDVYIGRPGPWGNPFSHLLHTATTTSHVATREEAIAKYREWIATQPDFAARARRELRGKVLGCWCKPLACHGNVLAEIADSCPVDFCRKGCPPCPDNIEIFRASGLAICDVCSKDYYNHPQFHAGTGHVVQGCDGKFYHL